MRPNDVNTLTRAFQVKTTSELANLVHDSKKAIQFAINNTSLKPESEHLIGRLYFLLSMLTNLSTFIESSSTKTSTVPPKPQKLVLIDDDELVAFRVSTIAKEFGIEFTYYPTEDDLLKNYCTIPKNCMFLVDWYLNGVTAENIILKLSVAKFPYVYLFTDSPDDFSRLPIKGKLQKRTEWMKQWGP